MHAGNLSTETPREGRFSWAPLLRLAGAALFVLAWLAPNHYLPWVFFHSEALAFAALLAWCASCVADSDRVATVPLISLAPLALLAVVWLQWISGLVYFTGEAAMATLFLGSLAASIVIGYRWQSGADGNRTVLLALIAPLVAAAFLSSLIALVQWFSLDEEFGIFVANPDLSGRPFANLAQPNLLGTLLVMGLGGVLWLSYARMLSRAAAVALGSFIAIPIALTQSRAALLSLAAVALWFAWNRPVIGPAAVRARSFVVPLMFAVMLAAGLWWAHSALGLAGEAHTKSITGSSGRWTMWAQMIDGALKAPLTGYGWHSSYAAQVAGAADFPGDQSARFAHDIFIDMLCWFGFPLGIAFIVLVVGWWLVRMRRAAQPSVVFAIGVALPVLVHSVFEFPFAFLFFLIPVGILAGAIEAQSPRARTLRAGRAVFGILALMLGALGAWTAAEYLPAEADFRLVRFQSMRVLGGAEEERPHFKLLTQLAALSEVGHAKPRPGEVKPADLERVRAIARKYPWAPLTLQYALYLEAAGRHEDAEKEMQLISDVYSPLALIAAREGFDLARAEWASSSKHP